MKLSIYPFALSAVAIACQLTLSGCDNNDETTYDEPTPQEEVTPSPQPTAQISSLTFKPLGSFTHGEFDESAAEITAYHPATKRGFVVNAQNAKIDVLDLSDPANPKMIDSLAATDLGKGINSVAVSDNHVALAIEANNKQDAGMVAIYDVTSLERLSTTTVGVLPDMVTFTPNGKTLLVANEGEPLSDYSIDPEGSISVIDVTDAANPVTTAVQLSQQVEDSSRPARVFGQLKDGTASSYAQDLEPEYISVSPDGKTAFVSLQENNAIAVLDIASKKVTKIIGLGYKDHSKAGNGLDASNKDDKINIRTYPLMGMYQPDAIASYAVNGTTYLVTANEGDAREYIYEDADGKEVVALAEEAAVGDLMLDTNVYTNAACGGIACTDKKALGKLKVTTTMGDTDNDGDYEQLYSFGTRSFSIWDTGNLDQPVYDSGDQMAQYIATAYPNNFNASNDDNDLDDRSDNKGVEPEGVAIGKIGNQTIAFIGLERISSVMAYDVTNPTDVKFLGEVNTRSFDNDKLDAASEGTQASNADGDLGPEGLTFISASESPNGKPLLFVGFEVSGTSRIFELQGNN